MFDLSVIKHVEELNSTMDSLEFSSRANTALCIIRFVFFLKKWFPQTDTHTHKWFSQMLPTAQSAGLQKQHGQGLSALLGPVRVILLQT
mmetsp:Transcript_101750/g.175680  ORF Transcript_101750/g.175680 Transcript_101750/m.175680 type:complete len:89 (-) Transcript_101750:1592-1858(-)